MNCNLSEREAEILTLILKEYTTNEIAVELHLTSETIKSHRKNLLLKFGARNVAGLVRRAVENHVIVLPAFETRKVS